MPFRVFLLRRSLTALVFVLAAAPSWAFDLQGHRGARGHFPENTLPAFAFALGVGVTTLELDAGLTEDGAVVVSHNRRLDPNITRDAEGGWLEGDGPPLRALTLDELRRFDVGALRPGTKYAESFATQTAVPGTRIPTLAEVVDLARRAGNASVRFNIEMKTSPLAPAETADPETFARALVDEIRRLGIAGRTSVQSFDWRTLRAVRAIAPDLPTVHLTLARGRSANVPSGGQGGEPSPWLAGFDPAAHEGSLPRAVRAAGGAAWSPFFRDLTPEALAEAKALRLPVVVWTVNDPADMERLIEMGVDGIITDYPDRLRAVLARRGAALPPSTPVEP